MPALLVAVLGVLAGTRGNVRGAGPDPTPLLTYYIAEGDRRSGYLPADRDLAQWAFDAWARNAAGGIKWQLTLEQDALIRLYWTPPGIENYGEMRPLIVDGRSGAAVFIRADMDALGDDMAQRARQDPLWRDAIVYLTCLHELGHALGLSHTANFADIMYFFGHGGDIVEYFSRYRRQLTSRADIERHAGLSDGDIVRLRRLHVPPTPR